MFSIRLSNLHPRGEGRGLKRTFFWYPRAKKIEYRKKQLKSRWLFSYDYRYYYKSFPTLGKRPPEPSLPKRKPEQPRVSCDEYEQGSCRWYDEWNYDHIKEYAANFRNMV